MRWSVALQSLYGHLSILIALGALGCNNTSFKSETPKQAQKPPVIDTRKPDLSEASLSVPCADGEAHLVTELKGEKSTTVRLEGEFCGLPSASQSGQLTAVFVLDISGSMAGNDPEAAGSCGRLSAAVAIIDKLKAALSENVEVSVGMVPFGTRALETIAPRAIDKFEPQMTVASFCRADGEETNYEAAFSAATQMLQNVEGHKVVYFISDGFPTRGNNNGGLIGGILGSSADPFKAGASAASELRALPDLVLNAIYLGNRIGVVEDRDPEEYFRELTGDAERVRVVADAADLAGEILKFEDTQTVDLEADSVVGKIAAPSFGERAVAVESLEPDPDREGVWLFRTEPFTLFGDPAKAVNNTVTFKVQSADGREFSASALVKFSVKAP